MKKSYILKIFFRYAVSVKKLPHNRRALRNSFAGAKKSPMRLRRFAGA
ncbi:hypothetical protein [Asticcacaulis sp. W401b]